jgi:hypothetical protein
MYYVVSYPPMKVDHMWSALLTSDHISTDIAVDAGRAVWFGHTRGAGPDQTWE